MWYATGLAAESVGKPLEQQTQTVPYAASQVKSFVLILI